MKLLWSPKSPFVRKVMVFAHEVGIADQFECERAVAIRTKLNPQIVDLSPVGRIPVLVMDDGLVLTNSFHICEYFDTLHSGQKLIPEQGGERWQALQLHGFADGVLDTAILVKNELGKPKAHWQPGFLDAATAKMNASLDWFEANVARLSEAEFGIGEVSLGVMLEYLDFRLDHLAWRDTRPQLKAWHQQVFSCRASCQATKIVNDE